MSRLPTPRPIWRSSLSRYIIPNGYIPVWAMCHQPSLRRPLSHSRADEEPSFSDQQKPAVFLLAIRRTRPRPRKLTDVKRIARNEQLGLISVSVAVHLP